MKAFLFQLLVTICTFAANDVFAQPPLPLDLPNENLKNLIEKNPRPFLPQGDWWSLAGNIFIFRHLGDSNYMHGPGYWFDGVAELRPHHDVDVNIKLVAANATSSYGYIGGNGDWLNLGITWRPRIAENTHFVLRYYDLGRTSIGAGLFFEDREMSGFTTAITNDHWALKFYFPGTSVYSVQGDLIAGESYWSSEILQVGFTVFGIYQSQYVEDVEVSPGNFEPVAVSFNLTPVGTVFVRTNPELNLIANAEAATHDGSAAGRLEFGYRTQREGVNWSLRAKGSYIGDGIVGPVPGSVKYDYLPYSMLFRPYHNTMNILVRDDDVVAWSGEGTLFVPMSKKWFVDATIEGGIFDYKHAKDDPFVWHKERIGVCPYVEMPGSCAMAYISNKVLNSDGYQEISFGEPVYLNYPFIGIEAQILF